MKARLLVDLPTQTGVIPAGKVIDLPNHLATRLHGKVEPISSQDKVIPLRRAWIENGELRTVGVFDDLAGEIVKLTAKDTALQRRLLTEHCQQYGPAHIGSLFDAWEERAAIMEHDGGMTREQAEEEAAKHYHLTAWFDELRKKS